MLPRIGAWKPDKTQPGTHEDYDFIKLKSSLLMKEGSTIEVVDLRKFCSDVEDQRTLGSCFHGDTLIRLLNGTKKTLRELHEEGKKFWIYSCTQDGKITPGEAICNMTGLQKSVIRIVLDNGETITCTPDHKFLLRNGSYCEAQNLTNQMSLMPISNYNHKIISIEFLAEKVDVYCLTVDNECHNFALACGVFVHNCVGNSVVGALELLQIRDGMPAIELSRLFVYYNSRLMHGWQDRDDGTYIRTAMGTLSSLGTCSEKKWPYDTSKVFIRPTWGSYREGYANKIDKFYRINGTGNQRIDFIKSALRSHHPVVFGMDVNDDFMKIGYSGLVKSPQTQVFTGGHAMLIVGFDDGQNVFIVRNSWGTTWGARGYCYLRYEDFDKFNAEDVWVPTSLK